MLHSSFLARAISGREHSSWFCTKGDGLVTLSSTKVSELLEVANCPAESLAVSKG